MNSLARPLVLLALAFAPLAPPLWAEESVFKMDFTSQPEGDAMPWLKRHGYEFELSFDDLHPRFENGALRFNTDVRQVGVAGIKLARGKEITGARRVRVIWGVDHFPDGADWEKGNNRMAVGVMLSFGHERLSSGLPFGIYAAPRFLCAFIGEREVEGKIYTGRFWKLGGRYLCVKSPGPGTEITTEIDVDEQFAKLFGQSPAPFITGVGIQMNSKDTKGKAAAFVKSIDFIK